MSCMTLLLFITLFTKVMYLPVSPQNSAQLLNRTVSDFYESIINMVSDSTNLGKIKKIYIYQIAAQNITFISNSFITNRKNTLDKVTDYFGSSKRIILSVIDFLRNQFTSQSSNLSNISNKNILDFILNNSAPDTLKRNKNGISLDIGNIFTKPLSNYIPGDPNLIPLDIRFGSPQSVNYLSKQNFLQYYTDLNGNIYLYPGTIFSRMITEPSFDPRMFRSFTNSVSPKNIVFLVELNLIRSTEIRRNFYTTITRILDTLVINDRFNIYYIYKNAQNQNIYTAILNEENLVKATTENINAFKIGLRKIPQILQNPFYLNITDTLIYAFTKLHKFSNKALFSIVTLFISDCENCAETLDYMSKFNYYSQYKIYSYTLARITTNFFRFLQQLTQDNSGKNYEVTTVNMVVTNATKYLLNLIKLGSLNSFAYSYTLVQPWDNVGSQLAISVAVNFRKIRGLFVKIEDFPGVFTSLLDYKILFELNDMFRFPIGTYFAVEDYMGNLIYHPLMKTTLRPQKILPDLNLKDLVNYTVYSIKTEDGLKIAEALNIWYDDTNVDPRYMSIVNISLNSYRLKLTFFWMNNTMIEPRYNASLQSLKTLLNSINGTNFSKYNILNSHYCVLPENENKQLNEEQTLFSLRESFILDSVIHFCKVDQIYGLFIEYNMIEEISKNWENNLKKYNLDQIFIGTRQGISKQVMNQSKNPHIDKEVFKWTDMEKATYQLYRLQLSYDKTKENAHITASIPIYYQVGNFTSSILAIAGIIINENTFTKIFEKKFKNFSKLVFYIIDSNGKLIYDSKQEFSGTYIHEHYFLRGNLVRNNICRPYDVPDVNTLCKVKTHLSNITFSQFKGKYFESENKIPCLTYRTAYFCAVEKPYEIHQGHKKIAYIIPSKGTNTFFIAFNKNLILKEIENA